MIKDSYGREIDYMRISITDRCNLRCKYCMPDGVEPVSMPELLTYEELVSVASCAASLGITHLKVTGGEPLARKGCADLIRMLKAIPGIEAVTLTTNGVLLEQALPGLLAAGVDGINISLDTLDAGQYQAITGYDGLETVKRAILLAAASPVRVRLNCVSLAWEEPGAGWKTSAEERTRRRPDWQDMVEFARNTPVDVRFIEMMPIGYGKRFTTVSHVELLRQMRMRYPDMEPDVDYHGAGPAVYYRIPGFAGRIGFISAIHGKFCGQCNRIRLTAQGYLKTCLCYEDGVDLRGILRQGTTGVASATGPADTVNMAAACSEETRAQLCRAMEAAIAAKPGAHCFEQPEQISERHNMVSIGG